MNKADKNKERRLRYALNKRGYNLLKYRRYMKPCYNDDRDLYYIVDMNINGIIDGGQYPLELNDVAWWVDRLR